MTMRNKKSKISMMMEDLYLEYLDFELRLQDKITIGLDDKIILRKLNEKLDKITRLCYHISNGDSNE